MTASRSHLPRRKRPTALFLPPPILHQRYTLGKEAGHGGSARVYHAWDTRQGQPVVLKRAHLSRKHGEALCYEAEILSRLHHPAIPTFVEYFEEEGRAYLVEAWKAGTPLKQLRSFAFEQVLWIGQHLCEVLEYLQRQHLVHRDIAPGNVLLDREHQTLALLDFGLAQVEPSAIQGSDVPNMIERRAGTPGYVAPEQWNEGTISRACDMYSVGMVLGCALTDCQPKEVIAVRSFADLWDDPGTIPSEEWPLLSLLDRMIAVRSEERPDVTEVHFLLSHLQRRLFGTD